MRKSAAIERAFTLARSGHCRSISEIVRHLQPEDREEVETYLGNHEARREMILICSDAWLAAR
jgi:hypothetical protein